MKILNLIMFLILVLYSSNKRVFYEDHFIRFKDSQKCMEVFNFEKNGNYITSECNKGNNQSWRLRYNVNDYTFTFISNANFQVMDIDDELINEGAKIRNWDNKETDSQRFYIQKTENCKYYYIINKKSGKCIAPENVFSDYSIIKQSTCNQNSLVYFQKPLGEIIYPLGAVGSCIPPPPSTQESAPIIPSSFNPYFTFEFSPVYQIYNPDYFSGTWIVDGMNCNNKNVSLQVKIDGILAIVSEGNDCYEDGSVLFLGNLPGVLDNKNSISVNYYTDGMQMSRVWLSITGNNTFVIPKYNLIFFRKL